MPHRSIPKASAQRQSEYWRATRRLTLQLLLVWLFVTFTIIFFARELSSLTLFGWPFSFYLAAQGATLIYVIIVWFYAWRMQRLDQILKSEETSGQ
jgi:putative solute:sodium symporter small subunit